MSRNSYFGVANIATAFRDPENLNYAHTMTLDAQGNLFVLSNEWPMYAIKEKRSSEMDFAIFRCLPSDMISGNICGVPSQPFPTSEFRGLKPQKVFRSVDTYNHDMVDPLRDQ